MRIAIAGGTGAVGQQVVATAKNRGHEVTILTRSNGIDLVTRQGLSEAVGDCDVVIDVASTGTLSTKESLEFFSAATTNLLAAEKNAGVGHHVALSIVGAAGVESGHYAGKTAQEHLIAQGSQPWSILRATQFHEFARQMIARPRTLGVITVPKMRTQPVAAAEVASTLVDITEQSPVGFAPDLAGPKEENMADMVRRLLKVLGQRGPVMEAPMPGAMGKVLSSGAALPAPGTRLGTQTFQQWLDSIDGRVSLKERSHG